MSFCYMVSLVTNNSLGLISQQFIQSCRKYPLFQIKIVPSPIHHFD